MHEKAGELKAHISELDSKEKGLAKLKESLSKLKEQLDEREVLEILHEALGRHGAEALMIKAVCQRLEQQVNKYARLLFPEDVTFHFDLETQFDIVVKRKYGKKTIASDVRKLSGAESLLFSLILLIALLAFTPPKNRCNILVLDEPTANFGQEMVDAFVKFLPILNSLIPHIIVITPKPNSPYPGSKIFTVVKKKGQSQIVEGVPVVKRTPLSVKKANA